MKRLKLCFTKQNFNILRNFGVLSCQLCVVIQCFNAFANNVTKNIFSLHILVVESNSKVRKLVELLLHFLRNDFFRQIHISRLFFIVKQSSHTRCVCSYLHIGFSMRYESCIAPYLTCAFPAAIHLKTGNRNPSTFIELFI